MKIFKHEGKDKKRRQNSKDHEDVEVFYHQLMGQCSQGIKYIRLASKHSKYIEYIRLDTSIRLHYVT